MEKTGKTLKINYNMLLGRYIITGATALYDELDAAQPTSRLLEGSADHGYASEYVGYGTVLGLPVRAVYLLTAEDEDYEDEGDYDWDAALNNGRIEIQVDKLTDRDAAKLRDYAGLKRT